MTTATKTDRRCVSGGAHHMVYEPPNGPLASGACKKCGFAEQVFTAHPTDRAEGGWKDFHSVVIGGGS